MSYKRDGHGEGDYGHVLPEDRPCAAQSSFAAKEMHASAKSHAVNKNCANDGASADQERDQSRRLVGLRHPLAAQGFQNENTTCWKSRSSDLSAAPLFWQSREWL